MPTALVTGSSGFIGTHLVKRLEKEGWEIFKMDLPFDVTKKEHWGMMLEGVEYVFHLAGHLDNYGEETDFAKCLDINVRSVALMFEVIVEKKLPIKKIIVASSQSIYGDRNEQELETHLATPISIYGASKAAMENILLTLGKIYQIPVVALRYSIVLGPGQKFKDLDSRILPCFLEMAKEGEIITHEDGKQTRDFINIHDLIRAHLIVSQKEEANNQIFNVGSGEITSVLEVAKYIANKFKAKVSHSGKTRINTARNQIMSIDKIKTLGWAPIHTWQDAVDEYIDSIKTDGN